MDIIYRYDPYQPIERRTPEDPDAAIRALRAGHARYVNSVAQVQREILGVKATAPIVIPSDPLSLGLPGLSGAAPVQAPFALVLGCSDARVPIETIFDQSPNDLFVVRVAGNVLGLECLGSVDFAVRSFRNSLRLIIVLGHTTCGAVAAAVDSYLSPKDYPAIAYTHALRSLVDRIQNSVRGAAAALEQECGASVARHPDYRSAMLEVAVFLNAALTAFDLKNELREPEAPSARIVYGIFDLITQRLRARPGGGTLTTSPDEPPFGDVPDGPEGFRALAPDLVKCVVAKGLLH
jgi:carbonic anhydrase